MTLIFSQVKADEKTTYISVKLKYNHSLTLNYIDMNGIFRNINFSNTNNKDTVINAELDNIKDPTQFVYISNKLTINKTNFNSILILPYERVFIDQDNNTIKSNNFYKQIDSIINIPASFYIGFNKGEIDDIKTNEINSLNKIDSIFQLNTELINKSYLKENLKNYLYGFNKLIKYTMLSKVVSILPSQSLKQKIYETSNKVLSDIDSFSIVAYNNSFLHFIYFNALKNGYVIDANNQWAYLDKVDPEIKNTKAYKNSRYQYVENLFIDKGKGFGFKKLESVDFTTLTKNKVKDNVTDSILKLLNIIKGLKTDFKKAKMELSQFDNGKHVYLFENEKPQLNISELTEIPLIDMNNNFFGLHKDILNMKAKIYVFDFWAQWCIPCINEFPFWVKIKEELKDKPIKFISISIDKKEDELKWKKKLKEWNVIPSDNHFSLQNFEKSPLTSFFDLRLIPRYIIINDKGCILDANYYKPREPEFKAGLLRFLNDIK